MNGCEEAKLHPLPLMMDVEGPAPVEVFPETIGEGTASAVPHRPNKDRALAPEERASS